MENLAPVSHHHASHERDDLADPQAFHPYLQPSRGTVEVVDQAAVLPLQHTHPRLEKVTHANFDLCPRVSDQPFIPFGDALKGGGDHYLHHRCPDEWITIELLKVAATFLARRITYDVPEQDLRLEMSKLPALPRSRFVIANIRTKSKVKQS